MVFLGKLDKKGKICVQIREFFYTFLYGREHDRYIFFTLRNHSRQSGNKIVEEHDPSRYDFVWKD